ncbi:MAG: hypothetical protein IAF58_21185, partial [Leptolyngbya sp.]|nr:hypothetical protein [Candidatus Melainabacteria bacterium]
FDQSKTPDDHLISAEIEAFDRKNSLMMEVHALTSELEKAIEENSVLSNKKETELSAVLSQLEKISKLHLREEQSIAWALNRLAYQYIPVPGRNSSNKQVEAKDFEKAKLFKLREINFHLSQRSDKKYKIRCHRALLNWYKDRGYPDEANAQIEILSNLLGTQNLKIINPTRETSCGMLVEDDLRDVGFESTMRIGCGMG